MIESHHSNANGESSRKPIFDNFFTKEDLVESLCRFAHVFFDVSGYLCFFFVNF